MEWCLDGCGFVGYLVGYVCVGRFLVWYVGCFWVVVWVVCCCLVGWFCVVWCVWVIVVYGWLGWEVFGSCCIMLLVFVRVLGCCWGLYVVCCLFDGWCCCWWGLGWCVMWWDWIGLGVCVLWLGCWMYGFVCMLLFVGRDFVLLCCCWLVFFLVLGFSG